MGAVVAFFIKGPEFLWLASGAIIGMLAGYLTGHSIDKAITNK
jgi:ABC-type dipeptide/oligopeptide/nickel transport system permease subunit